MKLLITLPIFMIWACFAAVTQVFCWIGIAALYMYWVCTGQLKSKMAAMEAERDNPKNW